VLCIVGPRPRPRKTRLPSGGGFKVCPHIPKPVSVESLSWWPFQRAKKACIQPRNKKYKLSFGRFRSFPGQTWPQDPFQRVRLEKWCRTHLKLAPKTNYKANAYRGGRFKGLNNMYFLSRPGHREPPKSAGNGGPGPPRYRRTVLGNHWISKSGWGTGWAPLGCPSQNAYSQF
jgi:hypothetical protein